MNQQEQELKDAINDYKALVAQTKLLELQLKELNKARKHAEEDTLPTMFQERGLSGLHLDTGETIEIKPDIYTSISGEHQIGAFNWLRETHNDGAIKQVVEIPITNEEGLQYVYEALDEYKIMYNIKRTIHHATLKSLVKEILEDEDLMKTFPKELFGLTEFFKIVIKTKK